MKRIVLWMLVLTASCSLFSPRVSVLDNPKCELPCWNTIVPGATTYSDALQMISDMEGVDTQTVKRLGAPWNEFSQRIQFQFNPDPSNDKIQTDVDIYFMESKVALLMMRGNINKTFETMHKITGEPELVITIPFPGGPSVMVTNPSRGVVYEFLAASGDLGPNTELETVMLFDPARYQDLLDVGMFSWGEWSGEDTLKMAYPWKGYGSVEELYPVTYP